MARAAVKAKQQARAKAQPAKTARARGRRRHSGGGNPNQQLFFMRLRRGQKWLYALLALIFAVTFAGVGVGSGSGGLSQLYSGLFGGNGDSISKAKDEIKKNPAKGYRDLATAYEAKSENTQAATALQSYLAIKKKDANVWSELGGLELTQAQTLVTQYQAAQQAAQLADPSAPFLPSGTLAQAVGSNVAYQQASQQASTQTSTLYQQALSALTAGEKDYKQAAKLQPRSATAQEQLATAAENAGDTKTAIAAWTKWEKLSPNSPQLAQVKARVKQLRNSLAPSKSSATVKSSGGSQSTYGSK
jgi:tetratricopeptide (TPR) repeat protein